MAVNDDEEKQALGPSIVLGLVGAVVVLVLLGAGIWGVGKIISKIRESREDTEEEQVAEESSEEVDGGETKEGAEEEVSEGEEAESEEAEGGEEKETNGVATVVWVANDYKEGDITGDTYTVVWGDTLWEIAEARYGSGFEWGKIRDANSDQIGYLPNGSQALIFPGQVFTLPE
jgi:nucleoid-associated protein YgaU